MMTENGPPLAVSNQEAMSHARETEQYEAFIVKWLSRYYPQYVRFTCTHEFVVEMSLLGCTVKMELLGYIKVKQ